MLFVDRTPTWLTPRVANVQPATFEAEPKDVPRKWKSGLNRIPARRMGISRISACVMTPSVALPASSQNWGLDRSPTSMRPSVDPQMVRKAPSPAMPTTLLTTGAHM